MQTSTQRDSFGFGGEFSFATPPDYDHTRQIDPLRTIGYRNFWGFDEKLSDQNLIVASEQLQPGRTYKAKIFLMPSRPTFLEECVAFLRTHKAILAGAQGLSWLWRAYRQELPQGMYIHSFGVDRRVSAMYWWPQYEEGPDAHLLELNTGHIWAFQLNTPVHGFVDDHGCLVCFCE